MKYMTAREEDILTNQNYLEDGVVIDKLLQSLIVTPSVNYNDLLIGDKNALLVASRILGYGADYEFEYRGERIEVDLTTIKDKNINEDLVINSNNEFTFTLPTAKKDITFKFLTHGDEEKIKKEIDGLKKLDKKSDKSLSTRLKHVILSVDGDYEQKTIRNFVDYQLLARDSRALRKYIKEIQPDVDLVFEYTDGAGKSRDVDIPIGVNFFWPDAEL
jgi:hypothetical protein